MFNTDQLKSLIRSVLVLLGGGTFGIWLAKHGFALDDNFYTMMAGFIATGVSVVWGQVTHKDTPTSRTRVAVLKLVLSIAAWIGRQLEADQVRKAFEDALLVALDARVDAANRARDDVLAGRLPDDPGPDPNQRD